MIGSRAVTGLRSIRRIKMASQSPVVRKAAATTSGPASAKRDVVHDGVAYATVQEGLAYILVPKAPTPTPKTLPARPNDSLPTSPQSVFYNPIQQFNRDLSVLAIRAFGEDYVRRSDQKSDSFKKRAKCRKDSRDAKRRCVDGAVGQPGDLQGGEGGETEQYDTAGEGASLHVAGDTVEGGNDLSHGKSGGNAGIANYASNAETAEAAEKTGFNEGQLDHLRRQLVDDIEDVSFEQELYEAAELAMANGGSKAVQGPSTEEGSIKAPAAEAPGIDVASAPAAEAPGTDGAHTSKDPPASSKPRCRFTILDALSATGLRALRYSSELPFVTSVTANDLSAKATDNIKLNVQHNGLEEKIQITTQNACAHMYSLTSHAEQPGPRQARYQVIDLDPYGTAVPMFDAALQALDNGGMLCVTCTDSSVFASSGYIEKTFSLYGGLPLKGLHSHEAGLRLVLHALCMTAARHGLVVEPLLSLSIDYYVRVFVKVRRAAAEVKFLASKTMVVYACDGGCGAWTTQYLARSSTFAGVKGELCKHTPALAPTASSRCEHCGFKTHVS